MNGELNNNSNNNINMVPQKIEEPTYICSKCGNVVKMSSRYCMKCGQLNYSHPDNQQFTQNRNVQNNTTYYQVGGGQVITDSNNNGLVTSLATQTGSIVVCFLINYFLYLLLVAGGSYFLLQDMEISIPIIVASKVPLLLISLSLLFLYNYSFQLLFVKCNKKWWTALIPIYNIIILSEIAFRNKLLGLLIFVPIIGEIYLFALFYKIGKKFRFNEIISILFFPIAVVFMVFGNYYYDGHIYTEGDKYLEKDYKLKKIFLSTSIFLLLVGIIMLIVANVTAIKGYAGKVDNYYYVSVAKKIVNKTKSKTENKRVSCRDVEYGVVGTSYLFSFVDTSKAVYLPLNYFRETISSYVVVTFMSDGSVVYEVALTDGNKKIDKININELTKDKVVDANSNTLDTSSYPYECFFQ